MNIFVFRVGVLDNHSFDTAVLLSGTARRNRVGRFWFLEGFFGVEESARAEVLEVLLDFFAIDRSAI